LDEYGDVICGPFGSAIRADDYVDQGIPLLRISNITKQGTLDLKDVVFLSEPKSRQLARTRVNPGDIVISQRGTLGMAALVTDEFPVYNISANLIAVRQLRDLDARFLRTFLASQLGQQQLARRQSGQVHAKITTEDVASLLIPLVANQVELAEAMEEARLERAKKIQRADDILADVDSLLFPRLGLSTPEPDYSPSYAVTANVVEESRRLSANFFHPERLHIVGMLRGAHSEFIAYPLGELVEFVRDRLNGPAGRYLGLASIEPHTGELTSVHETATGACFVFEGNDVLFARLRPYLNKVFLAPWPGCCSPEFHVLRIRDQAAILPGYLAVILRSRLTLAQTVHMMTGNTHPRLANEDVPDLLLPVPTISTQEEIIANRVDRMQEVVRLRSQAESEWTSAMRLFERELLGTTE
jgi:restriction endonuclease S subunit